MFSISQTSSCGLFVLVFWGRTTAEEGREALLDVVRHPGFASDAQIFVDLRALTEVAAGFPDVFAAVQSIRPDLRRFGPGSRCVLLTGVAEDGQVYGMARMLQQVVDSLADVKMRVVETVEEASTYLGRPVSALAEDDPLRGGLAGA